MKLLNTHTQARRRNCVYTWHCTGKPCAGFNQVRAALSRLVILLMEKRRTRWNIEWRSGNMHPATAHKGGRQEAMHYLDCWRPRTDATDLLRVHATPSQRQFANAFLCNHNYNKTDAAAAASPEFALRNFLHLINPFFSSLGFESSCLFRQASNSSSVSRILKLTNPFRTGALRRSFQNSFSSSHALINKWYTLEARCSRNM